MLDEVAKFGSIWLNIKEKKMLTFKVSTSTFRPGLPGLDRVNDKKIISKTEMKSKVANHFENEDMKY